MEMIIYSVCCLIAVAGVNALFDGNSNVVELTEANFDKLVVQSDDVWIVKFYAPWCGHCQRLAPEYDTAAKGLKGVVKLGGVNCDNEKSLPARYGVQGFPTLKIFGVDKNHPETYHGDRSADAMISAAFTALRSKVNAAIGLKSSDKDKRKAEERSVIELTDKNFEKTVLQSEEMWLVEFYAPWCGHCRTLAPQYAKAASSLKGKAKLGAVDATVNTMTATEYRIQGYPTIMYFPPGKKDKESAQEYSGDRTSSGIVTWTLGKLSQNVSPPEVKQILSSAVVKEECEEKPLCVISVLPHILDCDAACRNKYLEILTAAGDKYKSKLWGWVWSEAGQQPEFESALDIGGFGYPAMAVLNAKKMKYSLFKGAFSSDGVNEFLRDLSYGRGSTAPVRGAKMPEILTVTAWDGKDGQPPQEEEIDDLSDVDLPDQQQPNEEL